MLEMMTGPEFLPDDVPEADAAEQARAAAPEAEPEVAESAEGAPLESDESDWAEQRLDVDIDAEDDYR